MEPADLEALELVLRGLVGLLDELDAVVVDGGTDIGVMRAVGRARAAEGGRFPLIGVAAEVAVDEVAFEPNHTRLVLVPAASGVTSRRGSRTWPTWSPGRSRR